MSVLLREVSELCDYCEGIVEMAEIIFYFSEGEKKKMREEEEEEEEEEGKEGECLRVWPRVGNPVFLFCRRKKN